MSGARPGGKQYLKPVKDRLVRRLAEAFKDVDVMPLEQATLFVGQAMPPGEAIRYYRKVVDGHRLTHTPKTHRTKKGGTQTDDYRLHMGRRYRASDCIRNQIVHGRFVREEINGVKMLRITEHGRGAVAHWLQGEVAPTKNKRPD